MERLTHYNYALEKFTKAVYSLATGPGDVRSRLWDAYMDFHAVREKNIPEQLRKDFDWIMKMLTKRESLYDEGRAKATLRRMRNQTGVKIAEKIYDFKYKLERFIGEAEKRRK